MMASTKKNKIKINTHLQRTCLLTGKQIMPTQVKQAPTVLSVVKE